MFYSYFMDGGDQIVDTYVHKVCSSDTCKYIKNVSQHVYMGVQS